MRKKIINSSQQKTSSKGHKGLDLENLAQLELTSEAEGHPIESVFSSEDETGWRAAEPGEQTIRIVFDEPQNIRRIQLLFRETEQERSQEFLLRWLPAGEQAYREILRQQYNFSPPQTSEESEEYTVELNAVDALELKIIPDTSGRGAYASLAQLQLN